MNTSTIHRTSALRQTLRSAKIGAKAAVATLALAGSLAAVAPAAHAERVPQPQPGSATSLQLFCFNLQQRGFGLVAEYGPARDRGDHIRADAILEELRSIGHTWNDVCKGTYGDISKRLQQIITDKPQQVPVQDRTMG